MVFPICSISIYDGSESKDHRRDDLMDLEEYTQKVTALLEEINQLQTLPSGGQSQTLRSRIQNNLKRLAVVKNHLPDNFQLLDRDSKKEFILQVEHLEQLLHGKSADLSRSQKRGS